MQPGRAALGERAFAAGGLAFELAAQLCAALEPQSCDVLQFLINVNRIVRNQGRWLLGLPFTRRI